MENQVTNNANALRLFFTEDVFLVTDKGIEIGAEIHSKTISDVPDLAEDPVHEPALTAGAGIKTGVKPDQQPEPYPQNREIPLVAEEPVPVKTFKFLGANSKFVLILVHDPVNEVSSAQGRELLRKIVKAMNLGTPDFALMNYAHYAGTDFSELQQFFKPKLMLAFGVETLHLKLDYTWNNEIITHETTKMIFAPNLHDLEGDDGLKRLLWSNLRKIN